MVLIREARKSEARELSELAMRSKAYWGYSKEFMDACRQELLVKEEMISSRDNLYVVAEDNGVIIGFYALDELTNSSIEIGLLFVDPKHIGSGIGRALLEDAKKRALALGGDSLHFQGDPNAAGFYRAMGGDSHRATRVRQCSWSISANIFNQLENKQWCVSHSQLACRIRDHETSDLDGKLPL